MKLIDRLTLFVYSFLFVFAGNGNQREENNKE
jgi:hypothetical protein